MRVIAIALVALVLASTFICSSAHGRKPAVHSATGKHFNYLWTTQGEDKSSNPIATSAGSLHSSSESTEIFLGSKPVLHDYTSNGLILAGEGADLGGSVVLLFSYRSFDVCNACESQALVVLDKSGAITAKKDFPWSEAKTQPAYGCQERPEGELGELVQHGKEWSSEIKDACNGKHLGVLKVNLQGITREQ